jgi:hypothetical protein
VPWFTSLLSLTSYIFKMSHPDGPILGEPFLGGNSRWARLMEAYVVSLLMIPPNRLPALGGKDARHTQSLSQRHRPQCWRRMHFKSQNPHTSSLTIFVFHSGVLVSEMRRPPRLVQSEETSCSFAKLLVARAPQGHRMQHHFFASSCQQHLQPFDSCGRKQN